MTSVGTIQVLGASFFSTHHGSAADALTNRERAFTAPAYSYLVGRARRFTSLVTQMHIEVCAAVIDPVESPCAVFATCHGEIQTAETLITDFRDNAMVSSARFAMSVHNTASGVYSVATSNMAPTTTVTGANAIAAGWLEAVMTALDVGRPVLLSIADEPVPAIFQGPPGRTGVAAAFLLGPGSGGRRAQLTIAESSADTELDPVRVLARASLGDDTAIALGRIQPGAMLELRLAAEARA